MFNYTPGSALVCIVPYSAGLERSMKQNLNRQAGGGVICVVIHKRVMRPGCCCSFDCFPSVVITVSLMILRI